MRWVVYGLWHIWKCRNIVVLEKTIMEPCLALEFLHRQWSKIEGWGEWSRKDGGSPHFKLSS